MAPGRASGPGPQSWSTQQLGAFLAFVSSLSGEPTVIERAIERAAEILDAEVGALIDGGQAVAAVGVPAARLSATPLAELSEGLTSTAEFPGIGECVAVAVPLEPDLPHRLLIARSETRSFDDDEIDLIRGMARVIAVALRTRDLLDAERALREQSERQGAENVLLLDALRERQDLLERLAELQRSIVDRTALTEVLELVAEGVRDTIDADVVAVRLVGEEDGATARLVTSIGASQELVGRWREARPVELLSRPALAGGGVFVAAPADPAKSEAEFACREVSAAILAPLHERGRIAGSLAVGSLDSDRRFDPHDEEVVLAFAEHASLALNDARAAEEATHEAFHDALTGLPNRSLFIDRLGHALARVEREPGAVAVLFCDLDGFKTVNDSLGHAAGDRLLRAVGERLAGTLRPSDTVARFGGDEFAILLEELSEPPAAARAAGRVLGELKQPFEIEGREIFVGASIGIAATDQGARDADELLRNADLAMYRAKARGKHRYELFEPGMHAEVVRRMEVEGDLKRAIEREQLIVHYQPIADLPSGEVVGLEALVRWNHPTAGLIRPSRFIPIAEESGQIRAIGRFVLGEACRQLALWRAKYPAYEWLYVSVNVSGLQLAEPELVDDAKSALRAAQLEPAQLMLEVTETVLMDDTRTSIERLEALRALGIRLAMDDFGTGYSSLEYLDRLPLDALKIAKPFVDRLGTGPGADAIPRAIVDLSEIFGLSVIAEGIERPEQTELLDDLGCRFGQGNVIGAPLDAERTDAALFEAGLLGRGETGSAPASEEREDAPRETAP